MWALVVLPEVDWAVVEVPVSAFRAAALQVWLLVWEVLAVEAVVQYCCEVQCKAGPRFAARPAGAWVTVLHNDDVHAFDTVQATPPRAPRRSVAAASSARRQRRLAPSLGRTRPVSRKAPCSPKHFTTRSKQDPSDSLSSCRPDSGQ